MRSLFICCILFFVVYAMPGYALGLGEKIPPQAQNGMIDLRSWDLASRGPVSLDGDWEFSWKQLLTPGDFASARPWIWYETADRARAARYGVNTKTPRRGACYTP